MSKFNMVELLQFTNTINEMKTKQTKNISKFNRVELLQFTNTVNEIILSYFQLIYTRDIVDK